MFEYKIKIDKKIITILGPHLYGDTASIISELISNSYDADASNCWVTIITGDQPKIILEDDGIGMTPNDVNNFFLEIGSNRRERKAITDSGRRVFGRKGIGKLAAFSLAKTIKIFSVKDGQKAGCLLDYDKITLEDEEPQTIPDENISFSTDRLSPTGTGTRIELTDIKKNIRNTFYYLVNRIMRNFIVNYDEFKIHIAKNNDPPKTVKYSDIDYFSKMDTIVTIGPEYEDKCKLVKGNTITEDKYKEIKTYNQILESMNGKDTDYVSIPKHIEVLKKNGTLATLDFSVTGWVGTVIDKSSLRGLVYSPDTATDDEKINISVNDNRITIFSRGRIGEYDILPSVQTTNVMDAYVIGEIYADVLEDDDFIDMAISNRRGYEETDERYQTLLAFLKPIVRFVTQRKNYLATQRRQDERNKEIEAAKQRVLENKRTIEIFDKKLDKEEREIVDDDLLQFERAKRLANNTKRILISHNADNKVYGEFFIKIFENLGLKPEEDIIFTSSDRTGVPFGENIYQYLKNCFRDDLYVIFLFSKHFYDSNVCIAETGAAWATNRRYSIITLDIDFADVDKPIDNSERGLDLTNHQEANNLGFIHFVKAVLEEIRMDMPDDANIQNAIVQAMEEYDSQLNLTPFLPQRKFQGHPICTKNGCGLPMIFTMDESGPCYICPSRSCNNRIQADIS